MRDKYGDQVYCRYGFTDAFNPNTGWVSQYVIGIDAGIALLSAENLRNGRVWQLFMANSEPAHALDQAGLVKLSGAEDRTYSVKSGMELAPTALTHTPPTLTSFR